MLRCLGALLCVAAVAGCGGAISPASMPSASRQLRVFFSSPTSPSNELAQDLAPLMMFLSAMTQDYDDDTSGMALYQTGSDGSSLIRMKFFQRQPQSLPCSDDVNAFCQQIAAVATSPFPVRKCLQDHIVRNNG